MKSKPIRFALFTGLLIVPLLAISFAYISSSARKTRVDEPASEGRPITPAGTLIQDLTTRQVAVVPLPVDFVRSPDALGPNREGRYLISVNSGYGVQFTSGGNKGQQSLSVIDLNSPRGAAVIQNIYFPVATKCERGSRLFAAS